MNSDTDNKAGKGLTQQQRSKISRDKLVNAAIESIIDIGYSKTSTQEICNRAGLSKGGLFRQFASRTDLMIAAASKVYTDLLAQYKKRAAGILESPDPIKISLGLIRENFSSPEFQAAMELHVAARTDQGLAEGIGPVLDDNHKAILELSRNMFAEAATSNPKFEAVVDCIILMFQGEAFESVLRNEAHLDARMQLIEDIAKRELLPK